MSNDVKIHIVAQDDTAPALNAIETNVLGVDAAVENVQGSISGLSYNFSSLKSAASGIDAAATDIHDITSAATTASSAVGGLQGDLSGLQAAVPASAGAGLKAIANDAVAAQAATDRYSASALKGAKATGSINYALMNTGRVIQDLPYGIMGIANNIDPLVVSFQKLQKETGGSGAAIKAMLAGLTGPAGIALGVSAVTSLAVVFGDDLVRAIAGGEEKVEDLTKKLEGISEYEDLTFTLTVAGMSELEKLEQKLIVIESRLGLIRQERAWLEAEERAKASEPSFFESIGLFFTTGVPFTPEHMRNVNYADAVARERGDTYRARGEQIMRAIEAAKDDDYSLLKESYWGEARNEEFLAAAGQSAGQIKLLMQEFKELAKEANIAGKKIEELDKDIGDVGKVTENWQVAVEAAKNSLAGIDTQVKTVAQAKAELAEAEEKVTAAIHAGETGQKKLKEATDDVKKATKEYNKVKSETAKVEEEWQKAVGKAEAELNVTNELLGRQKKEMLSVEESIKKVIEAETELIKVRQSDAATSEDVTAARKGLEKANDGLADSIKKAADAYEDQTDRIADSIHAIGDAFESMTGSSIQGLGQLADAVDYLRGDLKGYDESGNPVYEGRDELQGYLGIASFVGQNIGGRAGGVISSTASMASAGASLGSIIPGVGNVAGAIIGGVVGLIGSLFGGGDDDERRARRDDARRQAFDALQDMALSGGPLSAELMRRSDWSWQNLSGLRHTDDLADEFGVWWPERLMADNGVEGIADRQEMIAAIDNLLLSIKGFTDSSFSQSLDQLNIKYEYLAEKSHNLALVEEARLTELTQLVTGINADSVVSSISSAMSAAASQGGDAGEIFMQNFTNEILDGVANTAISQMVTNTVMPILEEPLSRIAESMTAGEGFDTSALAEAVSLAQSAAASVAPAVQELYTAFDEADMWASDIKRAGSAWSAMIEQVTGLSAQTVGSQILQSIETVASQGGNIGKTFVNGFMQSVQDGLKKVAIDELMTGTINSILAPAMQHITESVTGGGGGGNANALNKGLIRNALEDAKMAAESVVPIIEEVYDVFKESGLLKDSYGTTKSAYIVDATEEQIQEAIAQAKLDWDANVQPLHDRIKELESEMEKAIIGATPRGLGYSPRESIDALTAAAKSLEEYRSDLVVAELGSALGYEQMLMNQKSVVSELAADAMAGTTDSRIAAMQDLPSALRGYLGSVKSMATDPKEYAREVARAQALLQGVEREAGLTEQQRTTDEIKQLREEMNRMSLTLARHTSQAAQILKRWEMSGFEVTETT